ncbi:hypothetical protein V6N13_062427 [Hibiscus sabdariffa]|uniref:Uncharacterized protein n=2 Tax=Hibiscus sabdariffa TaxID=183260 RepID=A0ABR2BQF3_9ROSI
MRPMSNVKTVGVGVGAAAASASPWHSPVPYLFGGLASMLALIALALFILACSYRRLHNNNGGGANQRDVESPENEDHSISNKQVKVYEEKILVIMAGEVKPTFLATPVLSSHSHSHSHSHSINLPILDKDGAEEVK